MQSSVDVGRTENVAAEENKVRGYERVLNTGGYVASGGPVHCE